MPANKGIINWIDTRLWSEDMLCELEGILYKFPEYPYRAVKMPNPLVPSFLAGGLSHLKTVNPLKIDTGREICVYIPLLPHGKSIRSPQISTCTTSLSVPPLVSCPPH